MATLRNARIAQVFDLVLVAAAVSVLILGLVDWRTGIPQFGRFTAFVLVTCSGLMAVILATDERVIARMVSPIVLGSALSVIASPLLHRTGTGMIPLWTVAAVLPFLVVYRGRLNTAIPFVAILVIAAGAAVTVTDHTGAGGANTPVIIAFAVYLPTGALLDWVQERLHGRAALSRTQLPGAALIAAGATGYAAGLLGALNLRHRYPGTAWASISAIAVSGLFALLVWQFARSATLRRLSHTLLEAAQSMPWNGPQIEDTAIGIISANVRADFVTVEPKPCGRPALCEQLDSDRWIVVRRRPGDVPFGNADARIVQGVAALARVSYIRTATESQLRDQAVTDDLTGLWEYKQFRGVLETQSKLRTDGEIIGVVFFDLDYFKQINETYGHMRADVVLETLGRRLRGVSRHWRFARFGGDEFVGMRHGVRDQSHLDALCEELQHVIIEPIVADGKEIVAGVTIGRTLYADPNENPSAVVARAEQDERRRKQARPRPSGPPTDAELIQALFDGGLRVVFQPVFNLPSRTVHGWEALLRCDIPGRGQIPPPDVIAAARRTDALDAITTRVAQVALDTADEACLRLGRRLVISFNLESDQIRWNNPTLEWVSQRADTSHAEILAEITERGDAAWEEEQYEVVADLERHGIGVALDDYGAGQSRLRAVARRRWHVVKLDRDFLTTDEPGLRLLRHNVQAMHELGQPVVLEGLESEALVRLAERLGIDFGQGYWLGRPISGEQLLATLDTIPLLEQPESHAP